MEQILKTTLIGLFFGTFGTTIGGIIGVKFKNPSRKFLGFILAFASGLMLAIVCFDLLPEAFKLASLPTAFLGIFLGIIMMIFCDLLVDKKFNKNTRFKDKKNTLLKTGIIVSIGLAIHNFPEGLAIGSGFGASIKLGLSLAIAICLHDIPEGRFQCRQQCKYA
ncbi:MAG: ZIP family metal transporter [Clostridia bacterium]